MTHRPCIRCGATARNARGKCTACQSKYFKAWYARAKQKGFNARRAENARTRRAAEWPRRPGA
jgi:hypothetical protein